MMLCDICGKEFEGHGNNPWPLEGQYSCNECNTMYVIPERLKLMTSKENDE